MLKVIFCHITYWVSKPYIKETKDSLLTSKPVLIIYRLFHGLSFLFV